MTWDKREAGSPPGDRPLEELGSGGDPTSIVKAYFVGNEDVEESRSIGEDAGSEKGFSIFKKAGTLPPPYSPELLVKIFEHSSAIRPNVDAYAVNIDGFGHRLEPVIDLDKDEAEEEVRTAMFFERLAEMEDGPEDGDPGSTVEPTDAEVKARIEEMRRDMLIERARLEAFLKFASVEESFISLRKRLREDLEVQGNGYWEVLRNAEDVPAQFNYLPAFTMRLTEADAQATEVNIKIKRTEFTFEEMTIRRRFRRFVQVFENRAVFFKEYGDPRVVSSKTGKYYDDQKQMLKADGEEGAVPATEVIHFRIPSSRTPYGIPRWVGVMLTAVGSRQAEEVNFLYFDNKSIPPLAVLVSGGRLTKKSVDKLESFIEERIKGRKNFHNILIIEGVPAENPSSAIEAAASGKMSVQIQPLTDAQQKDALFQNYDERNIDKIGMAFRIPRMLRGDIRDFNRATADAALAYAEAQVFGPERNEFDWKINRMILPEIGIRFWTFASNGPKTRDPVDLGQIIVDLVNSNVLLPEEARELAAAIFNRDFIKLEEVWSKLPPALVSEAMKQGLPVDEVTSLVKMPEPPEPEEKEPPEPEEGAEKPEDDDEGEESEDDEDDEKPEETRKAFSEMSPTQQKKLIRLVRNLQRYRDSLSEQEKEEARKEFAAAHDAENGEPEVERIELTPEEFSDLFEFE